MTDRHAAYIVILRDDIREDDAEAVMTALRMVSGVAGVEPVTATWEHAAARDRVRREVQRYLHNAIDVAFDKATEDRNRI